MNENKIERFQKIYPTYVDKINEMIESPEKYLIDYFDEVKSRVDVDFELKLQQIKATNSDLRNKINKKWIKLIDLIEKSLTKCIHNKLSDQVIKEAKDKLKNAESNKEETKLVKVKNNLESHLLQNDLFTVIILDNEENKYKSYPKGETKRICVIEEGLNQAEIEYLKDNNWNKSIKMKYFEREIHDCKENIIFIQSFQRLTELDCSFKYKMNRSINLLPEMFNNLTNLTKLRLFYAEITVDACFKHLTNLKELNLSSRLKELSSNAFVGLNQLEKLDLSNNNLNSFNKGLFNGLTNLKELILDECNLIKINKESLISLDKLEKLSLNNNYELKVESESFTQLPNLKTLSISSSSYSLSKVSIEEKAFVGLASLESLDLSHVLIIDLKKINFEDLKNLKELNLSYCNIKRLNENVFCDLKNLEILKLNGNKRVCFELNCLNGLKNLKELYLGFCNVETFERNVFVEVKNLKKLKLYHNYKICLTDLNGLSNLNELNLRYCWITRLDENFFFQTNCLEKLDLSYNEEIWFDSNSFTRLTGLKYLNLSICRLKRLKSDSFVRLNSLETLDLSLNRRIVLEEGCFNGLNRLKRLYLAECDIIALQESIFIGLDCLELINLNKNSNLNLEFSAFNSFKSTLKHLYLNKCNVRVLNKNWFKEFNNLKSLHLMGNNFILIEQGCFNGLNNLKELNLSSCGIKQLKENVFIGLDCLKILHLHKNFGINLKPGCFNGIPSLEYLYFTDISITYKETYNHKENLTTKIDLTKDKDQELFLSLDIDRLNGLNQLKCLTFDGYSCSFAKTSSFTKTILSKLYDLF